MTHFLLSTDSVHTTAAACDYLEGRLSTDDVVTVLTAVGPDADARDAGDAGNVAMVRIGGRATVHLRTRDGDPATVILDLLGGEGIDEVVIGAPRGGASAVDSTACEVVFGADVPVVVLPLSSLD